MFIEMNRTYRKSKRAEAEAETRQRILEAAIALHEDPGPRATTVSAIAERAGVQRLTVYRHFPDDAALYRACTSGWLELNPPPDPAAIGEGLPPLARCRAVLSAYHRYHCATQGMQRSAARDAPFVPALERPMQEIANQFAAVTEDLASGFEKPGDRLRATIGHALAFSTWDELAGRRLLDAEITDLTMRWVEASV
jgi:AcrR family transcriptional regulator